VTPAIEDALVDGLLGTLAHLAAAMENRTPGIICSRCGGLRHRRRGFCDVCQALRHAAERDYLIGEVEFLKGTDHPESIAARLGYRSAANLARVLTRYGRPDLAAALGSRELVAA
jgi:hypothetical protein